jgi:hypothetical protein
MTIRLFDPFSRAFERMSKALFRPFDIKKWFVVGFTAFLSELTDCGGNGGGGGGKSRGHVDWEEVLFFPQRAWEWLAENPVWATAIAFAAFLLFAFIILCVWWSSRGKFLFLDNVVHDRSQVVAPWHEYRKEGNSLFLWMLILSAVVLAVVIAYLVQCITSLQALYETTADMTTLILPAILMALGLFAIMLITGFIDLMLYDFMVPIMYRDRVTAGKALQKFMPLLTSHFFSFIGYTLFYLFVIVLVVIAVIIAGLVTCCIGFVLLALPYIGAVVLLPVSYTLRAFSVEFLEQFGPEFQVFPRPETNSPAAESPQVPAAS